jgi:hypothetical protein
MENPGAWLRREGPCLGPLFELELRPIVLKAPCSSSLQEPARAAMQTLPYAFALAVVVSFFLITHGIIFARIRTRGVVRAEPAAGLCGAVWQKNQSVAALG